MGPLTWLLLHASSSHRGDDIRIPRFAVALLTPAVALAQGLPAVRLAPPVARLGQEFSGLTSMRELRDGRVLLFDGREERFVVADFAAGTATDISRSGRGPGEFEHIVTMHALGGDSTLAADSNRWLILDGARVVATLPRDTPAIAAMHLWPLGADRLGRVLTRRFVPRDGDSLYLALIDRATGRSDTIARTAVSARRQPVRATRGADGSVTSISTYRIPLSTLESGVLFSDGWVAIARLDPYRVDWRSPDGQWVRGAPLPFTPIRMNDREKRWYAERNRWAADATDWPEVLPPFEPWDALRASPDGTLLIRRIPSVNQRETRYDIVDRRGVLQAQLVLPPDQHVHGFGARSVYIIRTDDDGIQRLQRHPWPPLPARG